MPTFTHVFYGLCLVIPILYFARERFSYKLAFIFLVNNIYGPDIVFLFYFIDPGFHSMIGFLVIAVLLALIFSYISRFSIELGEKPIQFSIKDTHIKEISWKNAYCAVVAGGISHFFIDQFWHWEQEMTLLPNLKLHIDDMLNWSGLAYHTMNPIMVLGELLVVLMLLASPFMFRKGWKESLSVYFIGSIIALILMLAVSTEVFGGERENAGMFSTFIYFFIPLGLLFYAARDINEHPISELKQSKLSYSTRYYLVVGISVILALIMLAYASVAIFMTETIVELVGGESVASAEQLQGLAYYYGAFALILFVGSIGLLFKWKIGRYLVMIGASYYIIFGFPIGITGFMLEEDTKQFLEIKHNAMKT